MKGSPQDQLKPEEKEYFAILAAYLKTQGGAGQLSEVQFAKLVEQHSPLYISNSTAGRKLKRFIELKLIDKQSSGLGNNPSFITLLETCRYEGSLPTGAIPVSSAIYINREEEEEAGKQALNVNNWERDDLPLVKVKAPRGYGKSTSLRFFEKYAHDVLKYTTCFIDLNSYIFDGSFNNIDLFLKKFSGEIVESLQNSSPDNSNLYANSRLSIEEYWRIEESPGKKCTNFLKEEIFKKASDNNQHIVLFIDGIDKVFGQAIETKFLGILRTWNGKFMRPSVSRPVIGPIIFIGYSTEPYKDFKGSPFNIGTPISLKPFSIQDILKLAKAYGLTLKSSEAQYLENLLGGHPTLIQHALYYINHKNLNINQFSQSCTQLGGPFQHILYEYTMLLEDNPNLAICFKKIMNNETCYDEMGKFLLERSGLVYRDNNSGVIKVSSILYQKYFNTILGSFIDKTGNE